MNKTLLLVSEVPQDREFAAEVAVRSGLSLKQMGDPKSAAEIISQEEPAEIFVDVSTEDQYRKFELAVQETVGLFSDKINANAIHFLSSKSLAEIQHLIQSPLFGHYILRNYSDPRSAGEHYGTVVKATLSDRAFGLANLFPSGTQVQVVKLSKSSQKQEAVEAIKGYLVAAKFQSRMAAVIANAVDELLMNAIFDAPIDDLGKPVFDKMPRNTDMKLEGRQGVEMHLGYDGSYVGITAVDFFGSLDKSKLLSHISKIYTEEEYKVRSAVAGAGIGLATVFRSGGSFFFVSESRVRTEVTVFFRKTDSFREFKGQFRFLSTQFYF